MSLVLDYLSASDAASLLYTLGVVPDDWMKKRYLNPVRDLGGLSKWLAGKMMDNNKVMFIGMDVERWIARIRRPWDASWKREHPIMVWVAVVPPREVMKESKEIRLYKSILASPDSHGPHGHLQMLRMHTHGWMNEFLDPGVVKRDHFAEGNMWVQGPMIEDDTIIPMFLNYQWSYRPGTTVAIHRETRSEMERGDENLFMVREVTMPTSLCGKVYETIWYDVASELIGRALTNTMPYLDDIDSDSEGPSSITVLVCTQLGFKQTIKIPLS
ncbi:hypothetical protein CDV31_017068 [Fusarium ambrosium]|uniref:Uncharacterized protein n=1 Tax=Fusarium ambrosium TaxID=131363 RepID=A0A428RU17_9HYPO|nr:hypothetical protein CDV31_017068 [Fusarium ambrosium]